MFAPLHNRLSLSPASSKKLTTPDQQCPVLNPEFFKPLASESGLSCSYAPEFYEVFSQNSHSQFSELAMLVLEYMTLHDKARLPLFKNASDRYIHQVLPAIQEKLASENEDEETLLTKMHIMNCASKVGYLTSSSAVFKGIIRLRRVCLIGMDLRDAYLYRADFGGANLIDINLSGANLTGANLYKANLNLVDLRKADLSGANISETNIQETNLSETDLRGADLRWSTLINVNLRGANLRGADLRMTDLNGADLRGADLSWANLSWVDLRGANLFRTNFFGSNLIETKLCHANLSEANLNRANLYGADLSDADLRSANFAQANLKEVYLSETQLIEINQWL